MYCRVVHHQYRPQIVTIKGQRDTEQASLYKIKEDIPIDTAFNEIKIFNAPSCQYTNCRNMPTVHKQLMSNWGDSS